MADLGLEVGPELPDAVPEAKPRRKEKRRKRALEVPQDQRAVAWYLHTIGDHELLDASEEQELSSLTRRMLNYEAERERVSERRGEGSVSDQELAVALAMPVDELKLQLRAGNLARERMVVCNLRLVVSVAKRFMNQGLTMEDLIQEGNLGLIRAMEMFDPAKRYRFSTYATYWIRQRITRALADHSRTIRLPAYLHEFLLALRKARASLAAELGRAATDAELAAHLGVREARVRKAEALPTTTSLETPVGDRQGRLSVLADVVPSHGATGEQLIEAAGLRTELEFMLKLALPPQERDVLRLRHGLDDGEPKSWKAVAGIIGLDLQRVRTVERSAMMKLRKPQMLQRLNESRHLVQ